MPRPGWPTEPPSGPKSAPYNEPMEGNVTLFGASPVVPYGSLDAHDRTDGVRGQPVNVYGRNVPRESMRSTPTLSTTGKSKAVALRHCCLIKPC